MFYFWLTSNFSLSLFYDSRLYLFCLGAFSIFFFFLSVKKNFFKMKKKKSLHELERPARTFYNDLFSLLMSRLKKQKDLLF